MRVRCVLVAVAASLAITATASAATSETIGNDVTQTPTVSPPCTHSACLYGLSNPFNGQSHTDGVVTSWSVHAEPNASGPAGLPVAMRLLVLRAPTGPPITIVGESDRVTVGAGVQTFPTRVRIYHGDGVDAGDSIALEIGSASGPLVTAPQLLSTAPTQEGTDLWDPSPGDSLGATFGSETSGTSANLMLSAHIESDADADGFGDVTQDACPNDANDHVAPCGAVTVGRPLFPIGNDPGSGCGVSAQPCLWAQSDLPVPVGGVITRYRVLASSPGTPPGVRALTPSVGFGTGVTGPLSLAPAGAMTVNDPFVGAPVGTFAARAPIAAGDLIGYESQVTATGIRTDTSVPGSTFRVGLNVPAAPGTVTMMSPTAGAIANNVDIEPDADHDGYGDSTQDMCPQDPATHDQPCTADLAVTAGAEPTALLVVGAPEGVGAVVTDNGPTDAVNATVTLTPPAGVKLVSATPTSGTCTVAATVSCSLGTIHPGASVTVAASAVGSVPGSFTVAAHAASDTADPNLANNDASLPTAFSPQIPPPPPAPILDKPCHTMQRGTIRPNTLTGTAFGDKIYGLGGRDLIHGHDGDDCLYGGDGDDVMFGDNGNDKLYGQAGNDRLLGGNGNDTLSGSSGKDNLSGGPGNDTISGGTGKDRISGGSGNDTISARDKTRDVIDCGPGSDTATVDKIDRVTHCEHVKRR